MIALLEQCHRRADAIDHADALMPKDAARLRSRHVALQDVQISAANGGMGDANNGISGGSDHGLGTILELNLVRAGVNEGFHMFLQNSPLISKMMRRFDVVNKIRNLLRVKHRNAR